MYNKWKHIMHPLLIMIYICGFGKPFWIVSKPWDYFLRNWNYGPTARPWFFCLSHHSRSDIVAKGTGPVSYLWLSNIWASDLDLAQKLIENRLWLWKHNKIHTADLVFARPILTRYPILILSATYIFCELKYDYFVNKGTVDIQKLLTMAVTFHLISYRR